MKEHVLRRSASRMPRAARRGAVPPRVLALVALLLALAPGGAGAQEAAVYGRVTDLREGPLPGASVELRGEAGVARSAQAGPGGEFELPGLAPGRYRLTVDHLGHVRVTRTLRLAPGERQRVDVRLRADTVVLEGVVVAAGGASRERSRFQNEPGVTARVVTGESLKTLPGLAEADVMRAVEVLPGVISTSDFSSAFNVRGGSADQNLILLDGFPIFNPFHLGGLFSVFNSDAIARAELLAGGFGAEYGGRVSSVLNVETRETEGGLRVEGGVSVLASRVQLRSGLSPGLARRLGVERGSWLLSARRSYFDQLLRPWVDFPYHLTDLQGHAQLGLRGGGRLSATAYAGADVLDLSDFQPPGGDSASVLRLRWNWGNRVAGLRWQQPVGTRWAADTRVGYSTFADALSFPDFGEMGFAGGIDLLSLRSDWGRSVGAGSSLRLGGTLERMSFRNRGEAGGTTFFQNADHGWLGAAYSALRLQPAERWLVEPGLRVDAWASVGRTRVIASPRLAAKRFLGPELDAAVKLSLGRYTQFLHSLRNEELPVSNDLWVLAGRSTPAMVSDQAQLGYERYWGERWSASVEAYARTFRGVTEINYADDPNDEADDLVSGTGRSYGLDLLVRRNTGRLTGWTTVSLLRATRTMPDLLAAGWDDLAPTVTFPPVFDRRVDVDLVLQYRLPGRLEAGARWNYGSPIPYTRPVGQHFAWRYSLLQQRFEPQDQPGRGTPLFVLLGARNAARYPPYHRLDLTVRRTFRPAWGAVTPYLQVLNAYNRKNVLWYFYNYNRIPATRSGISMFPVLPAVGVEVAF